MVSLSQVIHLIREGKTVTKDGVLYYPSENSINIAKTIIGFLNPPRQEMWEPLSILADSLMEDSFPDDVTMWVRGYVWTGVEMSQWYGPKASSDGVYLNTLFKKIPGDAQAKVNLALTIPKNKPTNRKARKKRRELKEKVGPGALIWLQHYRWVQECQ